MILLNIDAIPNQSFSARLDDSFYNITIKETNGVMSCSIARDNIDLITGSRIVSGSPLIPYKYQERGNFVLTTMDGDLPAWEQFGVTQTLLYLTNAEVDEIRAGT